MSGLASPFFEQPFPRWVARAGSDDLDEANWLVRDKGQTLCHLVRHGRGPLGYRQHRMAGSTVHMGDAHTEMAVTMRGRLTGLVLHLCPPVGSTYQLGRRRWITAADAVAVLPPGLEFTRFWPPGTLGALRFEADRLCAELRALAGPDGAEPVLPFVVLSLSAGEKTALQQAACALLRAAGPDDDERALTLAEFRLYGLAAGLLQCRAEPARAGSLSARRLAALEDWIDAHLAEPLTLGRLCEQAGVGARCLQKAFEVHRGMSPMRYVAERRLLAAYRRLRRAEPTDSVTAIAIECGFDHLSRFAQGYRQLFGERPSQTLALR